MPDPEMPKCTCGHEIHYHQGNGTFFNTRGCGVSWCKCSGYVANKEES